MKTTIVFRGLMVLHKYRDTMEIGFVDALYNHSNGQGRNGAANNGEHSTATAEHSTASAEHATGAAEHSAEHSADHHDHNAVHIPRILTTKNGVLSEIFDLRNRPELGTVRNWTLEVTNPVEAEAVLLPQVLAGGVRVPFDRRDTGSDETDFRWITDMEANDLHGRDLSLEINTRQFLFVLYVRHGEFYTRLKSPVLRRRQSNPRRVEPYGATAAVVGCDINFNAGGGVRLMAGGPDGSVVYDFDHDEDTVYEISNGPPDVPVAGPVSLDAPGHFHMYYEKLFPNSGLDQFDLITEDRAPAPDPTLCGVTFLGRRGNPL